MLYDYLFKNVRIGRVAEGKRNEGKYYVTGEFKNAKFPRSHGTQETIWQDDDPEFVNTIRSMFPATGKDLEGNDWNGLNKDLDGTTWGAKGYNDAIKALQNLDGINWLLFSSAKNLDFKLDGLYCMKFATNLIGNGTAENPQFKEGEYIKEPSGHYVKVYDTVTIFVMMYDEAANQYVEGWGPKERLRSKMRNMVPLAAVIAENPDLVDPRYKSAYVIPTVTAESPAATSCVLF